MNDDSKRSRLLASEATISAIMTTLLFGVHLFTLAYNMGYAINPSFFAAIAVGIVLIAFGNLMPRLPQNGLRPWRMPDRAYAKFARYQGRLMVATGMLVLIAIVLQPSIRTPYLLTLIGLIVAGTLALAIYFSRRHAA